MKVICERTPPIACEDGADVGDGKPVAMLRADRAGTISFVNEAGMPVLAAWGRQFGEKVPAPWMGIVLGVLASGTARSFELNVGETTLLFVAVPSGRGDWVDLHGVDMGRLARPDARACLVAGVFESTAEPIVITDAQAAIVYANPAYCAMSGYERSELIGMNPRIMKSDRHGAEFYEQMWNSLVESGQWRGEVWDRRKNGEVFPKWLTINAVRNAEGAVARYVGINCELTEVKREVRDLERLVHYDPLTGLANRILFRDRLQQAVNRAKRGGGRFALLFLDLDGFKRVNDTLGHAVGDLLLVAVGERLGMCLRATDSVSRLSGDEFTIILSEWAGAGDIVQVARKILAAIAAPFTLRLNDVRVTASVGVALYPDDAATADELLSCADQAMYVAKDGGRAAYRFFSKDMHAKAVAQIDMEQDLRLAIEREEFVLHYQPQVDLRNGRIVGIEALIRWQHPRDGLVPPSRFVPAAERSRLIGPIGEWVMRTAFRQTRKWRDAGLPGVRMAWNVAAQHFEQPGFADAVAAALIETGVEPGAVEIEVTESSAMRNPEAAIQTLHAMRMIGVHVSVDDFGTGYSSLSYLQKLPIESLKIDRSFVRALSHDPGAAAIVTAIVGLARSLRLQVVAEGVETMPQVAFLRELACDRAQGFLCSRPVAADRMERLLASRTSLIPA